MSTTARSSADHPAHHASQDAAEILERHLNAIADQADVGTFDPNAVDAILTLLVAELRNVCGTGKNLETRLADASRALMELDGYAEQVRRRTGAVAAACSEHTIAGIIARRRQGDAYAAPSVTPTSEPCIARATPIETAQAANAHDTGAAAAVDTRRLDGRALGKSIRPTWLALVGLSWVSLIWGGIISAPLGVGAVVLGGTFAGMVAVPLWATVFGFMGMNRARSSTLASVGFEPCADDDALHITAKRLAGALGIPTPEVGTMSLFNAFAMGSNVDDATVAIGRPLMEMMSDSETEAILGHELGHVVSGDMRRMMLMRTFQNATVWFAFAQGVKQLARWVICWGAELYILAFSRQREFWADAIGAALTSKEAMIGALSTLERAPALTEPESTHARFMVRGRFAGMFSTHPSFEARIEALRNETYLRQLPRLRPIAET